MNSNGRHIPISYSNEEQEPHDEDKSLRQDPLSSAQANDQSLTGEQEDLQQQLAAQQESNLRLRADFDNFIKRSRRDAEQQAALAKEAFILELLGILDNLERALTADPNDSCEPLHRGVAITLQEVGRLLQRHGIEPMDDLPFDPHRHEAVFVQNDPGRENGTILAVLQRGYCRGDKVFRPAQVIVNDWSRTRGEQDGR